MEVLAVLLSMATIVLSSYPCCQETGSCSVWEVVEHGAQDGAEDIPYHQDSTCSPFYTCGRCTGFTISFETLEFVYLEPVSKTLPIPYLETLPKEVNFHSLKPPRTFEV